MKSSSMVHSFFFFFPFLCLFLYFIFSFLVRVGEKIERI